MIDPEARAAAVKVAVVSAGNVISWSAVNEVLSVVLTILTIVYVVHQIIYLRRKINNKAVD